MHWHRARRAGGVLVAAGIALLVLARPAPPEVLLEAPDAGVALDGLAATPGVMTDGSGLGEEWAGIPIPAKPRPDQETKCDATAGEVSINGGCYLELSSKPPCPPRQYEHGGKCWVAVGKRSRPATSVGQ
jgi:hypothetical protein